ncbi:unnamed protein product [Owenia fusiformis]|uniref:Uncharacterized protein n=1 Tax=Owenia fusiformis TaxID=6347 RepID=A0A8J1TB48_OWEFU|nr:unnamed protein product [Owenia fusiformis]
MPIGMDQSHFLMEKLKKYDSQIQGKDERIVQLETENAMLYLRLAKLQGQFRANQEDTTHWKRMCSFEQNQRRQIVPGFSDVSKHVQSLRQELEELKLNVSSMPTNLGGLCNNVVEKVDEHSRKYKLHSSSLTDVQQKLVETESQLHDALERHAKEKKRRRELHNTLMELRGNIRVHCRVRPLLDFDRGSQDVKTLGRVGSQSEVVVHVLDDENVCIKTSKQTKAFEFERVYSPLENQDTVFEEVQPMLTSLLDGYNVCIMTYGQTGSGKTHTMLGSHSNDEYHPSKEPHKQEGIIPRAARELFSLISEKPPDTHSVEVSVVEIYNNDIRDLLSGDPNAKHDVVTASDGSLYVPTVSCKPVETVYDVMCSVQHGLQMRSESPTLVHEHSSRSHLIVTLTLTTQANYLNPVGSSGAESPAPSSARSPIDPTFAVPSTPTKDKQRRQLPPQPPPPSFSIRSRSPSPIRSMTPTLSGAIKTKLQLVDLAGSECVGMSGATGDRLRETSNINKSLSALADVLGALAEHRSHVPYRNSRVTHLLQDSIGGDAKLLVVACVSPAKRYLTESLQCLGFSQRARQVQRGPIKRKLPPAVEKIGPGDSTNRSASPRPRSAGPLRQ